MSKQLNQSEQALHTSPTYNHHVAEDKIFHAEYARLLDRKTIDYLPTGYSFLMYTITN